MRLLSLLLLAPLAVSERIERQVRRHLQESFIDSNLTKQADEINQNKKKYVEEKLAIEREVVAPFVAKAAEIPAADTTGKQKLAFIFLTMKDLQWPSLWESFFKDAPPGDYSIYIHQAVAKPGEPPLALPLEQFGAIRVPWVRTAWCALFGVEVATLFEALKDPTNAQFVFVSDSTVPLKNFSYVHKELMQVAPQSSKVCLAEPARFALAKTEMMKQESLRKCFFRDFLRGINPRALKHHQWLTLTRRHAAAVVVHAEDALNIYEDAWLQAAPDLDIGEGCSDEAVPVIALLASLTSKGQSSGNTWTDLTRLGVEQECLTYVRWRNCFTGTELALASTVKDWAKVLMRPDELKNMLTQSNFDFMKSSLKRDLNGFPHYFENITEEYLWNMASEGFMFARKFAPGIKVRMTGKAKNETSGRYLANLWAWSEEAPLEPLEDVLPKMWSDVVPEQASTHTWRRLETAGKPSALGLP